jgi:hypothetical protein
VVAPIVLWGFALPVPFILVAVIGVGAVSAQRTGAAAANEALRAELVELAREDQRDREDVSEGLRSTDGAYAKRLMSNDAARTDRLKAIVARHGWPTVALVGRDGVKAAWLLLQHSEDWSWQKSMLPAVEAAADAGEIHKSDLAVLTDRVLVRSGRPQRYGNSFSLVGGRLVADPIEDEARVDERRAAVGLPAMAEYARELSEMYKMPVEWPRRTRGPSR